MPRITNALRATAYHEAGHAVAAMELSIPFRHVTIKPDPVAGTLGNVRLGRMPKWFRPDADLDDRTRLRAEAEIVTSLAGPAAEARLRGHRTWWRGAGQDLHCAVNMIDHLCGGEEVARACFRYLAARADALVAFGLNWIQLEAIADALIDRTRLSAAEACLIAATAVQRAAKSWREGRSAARVVR